MLFNFDKKKIRVGTGFHIRIITPNQGEVNKGIGMLNLANCLFLHSKTRPVLSYKTEALFVREKRQSGGVSLDSIQNKKAPLGAFFGLYKFIWPTSCRRLDSSRRELRSEDVRQLICLHRMNLGVHRSNR